MIVLLKNIDNIVAAHAYVVNNSQNTLDSECATYKKDPKNPDAFPDTVRNDKHKTVMTVGYKDSDLLNESYHYDQRFVSHYGDIAVWASNVELGGLKPGDSIFIWLKDEDDERVCYVFHPYNFIRRTPQSNILTSYGKGKKDIIWSISLIKNDRALISDEFLHTYELN